MLFVLIVAVLAFLSGKSISDRYHEQAALELKEALERQYVRLQTGSDADDPCKPYIPRTVPPQQSFPDELLAQFEKTMKTEGQATAFLKKQA